jgi:hypothetical protein
VTNNKSLGEFITQKNGTLCFKYKSDVAKGEVILYSNGRYQVIDGPNKGVKGDYDAKKNISLKPPKEGFKKASKSKNESLKYLNNFEGFSFL